jgi:hypothetical protein
MKLIKLYEEFLNEKEDAKDLYKIYLAVDPKSGQRFWSFKGFAGSKFFVQLTPENYKDVDINPDYPVLTYNSRMVNKLLDANLVKLENVYNKPEYIKQSGSKAEFHKLVEGDENIPKTCYKTEDAVKEVGFPMIAKPAEGHSGIGIQVLKTQEDFDAADHDKLDVYSEYIDKVSEHRFFTFKGKPFFWQERNPQNDKAKTGDGDGKEKMSFTYTKKNLEKLPQKYLDLIEKYGKIMSDLPYICFDVMESKDGKLYIIESNSQPGVPFDSTVHIYRTLFKDFFGRDVDAKTDTALKALSKELCDKTLDIDKDRFFLDKDV